jgi:hypothetical protein
MKNLGVIGGCAVCFLLGTLMPLNRIHAQMGPANATYYNISFMKSRPGQNPISIERELWKPIHEDLLQSGKIKSWTVIQPMFSGPHNYDYMTMIAVNKLNDYMDIDYQALFEKHWGKDKMQSSMQRVDNARDMVGNEMWYVVESVGGNSSK